MKRKIFSALVILLAVTAVQVVGQQNDAPKFKLIEFQMALLKPLAGASTLDDAAMRNLHKSEHAYLADLVKSGKAVLLGPFTDNSDVIGVIVFRAKNADEARPWIENEPGVKAGRYTVEMHPWWSVDVMKPATMPLKFTQAYFAFLKRGPKWTPEVTPQTEAIQKAHLANINRLADMKKLVIAGPFGDDGMLRGIFIFKVASMDEAKELANTDPAVQAGRLMLDIHPWQVPEGMLP